MKEAKVIAFVGMTGSGKGTCTSYLNKNYGWPVIHFGNMVYEEVQRRGLDNVKDETFVREDMRKQEGPAVLAKHVARKIRDYIADGEKFVVLDGLYSWSEYKHLHEVFGENIVLIAVVATKALRYKRVLERQDTHRSYTVEQVVARDIAEIENLEKGGPIAYADYTLLNNGAQEELLANLDVLLQEAGISVNQ
jgi:dephospho-CoA kinase